MDSKQYKQRKKRAVDPNAPPRPNLLSHEKRMKESDLKLVAGEHALARLKKDLHRAEVRISDLEAQLNDLIRVLNNRFKDRPSNPNS